MTTTHALSTHPSSRPHDGEAARADATRTSSGDARAERGTSEPRSPARDPRRSPFRAVFGERAPARSGADHGAGDVGGSLRSARPALETTRARIDAGEDREPRAPRPKPLGADEPKAGLEPFRPPSEILAPPTCATVVSPTPGSGAERAEAAALAERLVLGLRVGRVGRDGHVVQLRLRAASGGDIDVRLRHEDGRLAIVLVAEGHALTDAHAIERTLREELGARGLSLESLEVQSGS